MARDMGLEELLSENLAGTPGLTQKAMFGGMAWLVNGNLLATPECWYGLARSTTPGH